MSAGKHYKPATPDDLHKRALRIIKGTATFEDRYFADLSEAIAFINILRSMECTIVFITGVWDLIHIGHATYIARGKEAAQEKYPRAEHTITVIGVDSDAMTKQRKGDDRPIVGEDERLRMLGHLRSVDVLVLQTEPDQLFKAIPHDVRVLSESTKDLPLGEMIAEQCEHVITLPPQAETSTTARIRRLHLDGGTRALLKIEKGLEKLLKEARDELNRS